jgi:quinol monooxygenase YgiN
VHVLRGQEAVEVLEDGSDGGALAGGADHAAIVPARIGEDGRVFAMTRLRVRAEDADELAAACADLLGAFGARPGFLGGELGRSADDPALWGLLTRWDGVGSYRRALSAAEVKIAGAPVWVHAVDEPGVYVTD